MDKRTRLMVLGVAGVVVALVGVYMLWSSGGSPPPVDAAIVEAAAESSRQAQKQAPAPVDEEPKREGRARPGAMGVGGGSAESQGR